MKPTLALAASLLLALLAGCYWSNALTTSGSSNPFGPDAGAGGNSGLPCDLQAVLATKCQSCHSAPPVGGAPMSLMTSADLIAPTPSDASKSVAQRCVERMSDGTMPAGGGAQSDAPTLQAWITAGMPATSCGNETEAGANPYDTPVQCSSGKTVAHMSNDGSRNMNPGESCSSAACHDPTTGNGPAFDVAGTIYQTAHEPLDCNGFNGTGKLNVTGKDKSGRAFSAPVNAVGNFWYYGGLTPPLSGLVVTDTATGATRAMSSLPPSGDCNSCHTETGANPYAPGFPTTAPGRIMTP